MSILGAVALDALADMADDGAVREAAPQASAILAVEEGAWLVRGADSRDDAAGG